MNQEKRKFIKVIKRRIKRKGHLASGLTKGERNEISKKAKSSTFIKKS